MENIKRNFELILKKFNKKRAYFAGVLAKWKHKGLNAEYAKYNQLFENAQGLSQQLNQDLFVTSEGQFDQAIFSEKIKKFKEMYKTLNEVTKPVWRQWIEAVLIAMVLAFVLRHTIFSPYHVPSGSAEPTILVGDRIWGNKLAYNFEEVKHGDLVIFDHRPHSNYVYNDGIIQYLWQRYVGVALPLLGLKEGPINVVKRVVAVPGDLLEGRIEDGKTTIYLNGNKLNESYVNPNPLIYLHRKVGLLPIKSSALPIPKFLCQSTTTVKYTYVENLPYEKQPYYNIYEDEVIMNHLNGKPMLDRAYEPIYTSRQEQNEYFSVDSFGPIKLPKDMYWVMGDSRKNSEDSRYWGMLDKQYIRGRASFILFSIDSEEAFWLFDLIKNPIRFWTKNVRWNRCFKKLS